jgi:hypothetical protein
VTRPRDPTLDVLLDLDGQVLVVDPDGGHWVRFVVTLVPVSPESRMASTTRSPCMARRASGWSDSTMPTRLPGRGVASRWTIATGYDDQGL